MDRNILDILVYGLNVRIYVGRIVFKGVSGGREAEDKG